MHFLIIRNNLILIVLDTYFTRHILDSNISVHTISADTMICMKRHTMGNLAYLSVVSVLSKDRTYHHRHRFSR